MWILGRIFMPTPSCQAALPCILVLLIGCRRRSLPSLHPPSRLRLLLLQRGSTQFGLEDPSLPLSQLSSRCGSLSKNMMNQVQELFTENVFKYSSMLLYFPI